MYCRMHSQSPFTCLLRPIKYIFNSRFRLLACCVFIDAIYFWAFQALRSTLVSLSNLSRTNFLLSTRCFQVQRISVVYAECGRPLQCLWNPLSCDLLLFRSSHFGRLYPLPILFSDDLASHCWWVGGGGWWETTIIKLQQKWSKMYLFRVNCETMEFHF